MYIVHFVCVAYCRRVVFKTFNKYMQFWACACVQMRSRLKRVLQFRQFSLALSPFLLTLFCSALTRNLTQINENNKNDSQNNNNFNQCICMCVCKYVLLWIYALHNVQASKRLCAVSYTEHKVFQYKYCFKRNYFDSLCVLHSHRWSHALIKKKLKVEINKQQSTPIDNFITVYTNQRKCNRDLRRIGFDE